MSTLQRVHDFELALVEPCMAILQRGILIDNERRRAMMAALEAEVAPLSTRATEHAVALLQASKRLPKDHLFREKWVCPCCRGGKAKMAACWGCAGLSKPPSKRLLDKAGITLEVCKVCGGEGKREQWTFNPSSHEQVKIVLYKLLKLPTRMKNGKLRSDEEALKDLRAFDTTGFVDDLLAIHKAQTVRAILDRMAPGEDGRLRTWLNIAGTETGRFSSSETFLLTSTNLQNLPKRVASLDVKYEVRNCVVPAPGHVLVEADLSQAEARVVAALCNDQRLLKAWQDPDFDVHKWTAAHIFSKPPEQVTSRERQLGKVARHALNYGMQWKLFQRNVNAMADLTGVSITAPEAQRIHTAYHRLHGELEGWWRQVDNAIRHSGALWTPFGRRRIFFGRRAGDGWLDATHREAIAYVPQSTVADLLNRGLMRWWASHDGKLGQVILQVHDSLLVEASSKLQKSVVSAVRMSLSEAFEINGLTVTIPCDVSMSAESWGKMKEV